MIEKWQRRRRKATLGYCCYDCPCCHYNISHVAVLMCLIIISSQPLLSRLALVQCQSNGSGNDSDAIDDLISHQSGPPIVQLRTGQLFKGIRMDAARGGKSTDGVIGFLGEYTRAGISITDQS